MAERHGTDLLGRDEEERGQVSKRVFSTLEIQFKSLGNKGFQKFRKDAHEKRKTRIVQPEVICWLISPSGLMYLKLHFYTATERFILLANRGTHL